MERERYYDKLMTNESKTDIILANERYKCCDEMVKNRRQQEEEMNQERLRMKNKLIATRRNQNEIVKNRRRKLLSSTNEFKKNEAESFRQWRLKILKDLTENTQRKHEKSVVERLYIVQNYDLEATARERIRKMQELHTEAEKKRADEIIMILCTEIRENMAAEKNLIENGINNLKQQQLNDYKVEQKNAVDVMEILMKMQLNHLRHERQHAEELMEAARKIQNEHKNDELIRKRKLGSWLCKTRDEFVRKTSLKMMSILKNEKGDNLKREKEQMKDAIKFMEYEQCENLKKEYLVLQGNSAMLVKEMKHLVKEEAMSELSCVEFRRLELENADNEEKHFTELWELFKNEVDGHIDEENNKCCELR